MFFTPQDMAEVMLKCLEHQKSKDQVETLLVFILDFLYKSVKEINEYSKFVLHSVKTFTLLLYIISKFLHFF